LTEGVLTALDPTLTVLDPIRPMTALNQGMALPVLTALDPIVTALEPTEGVPMTALDSTDGMALLAILDPTGPMPMSTALDLSHPMPMSTDLDLIHPMPMSTALDLIHPMPMLTPLDPTDPMPMLMATECMAFLTDPDPTERMAFLTAPDSTAGPVEVGRLSVPGSAEDHLNLCPVGAAGWSRVAAMSSQTPECSTAPKERRPATVRGPSDGSRCLLALGSAAERHLNLSPMANY
jgi:hypothetical protein